MGGASSPRLTNPHFIYPRRRIPSRRTAYPAVVAMAIQPLRDTPSLSTQAYEAIKLAILSLAIRPGDPITLTELAGELGISRTPVRDALLRLEREGLVTVHPRRGACASLISARDIQEIYELRILLESQAARLAAEQATADELAAMESVLQDADDAFRCGDLVRASALGARFHDLLDHRVVNRRLANVLGDLDLQYQRIRHLALSLPGRAELSHVEHRRVLATLAQRDASAAAAAMAEHLVSVRDSLLGGQAGRTTLGASAIGAQGDDQSSI